MSFLRRLVALRGNDHDSDEGEEGEALLEHGNYNSSESESSSSSSSREDDVPIENGLEEREWFYLIISAVASPLWCVIIGLLH